MPRSNDGDVCASGITAFPSFDSSGVCGARSSRVRTTIRWPTRLRNLIAARALRGMIDGVADRERDERAGSSGPFVDVDLGASDLPDRHAGDLDGIGVEESRDVAELGLDVVEARERLDVADDGGEHPGERRA